MLNLKPKIHNVVCTADLKQKVDILKFVKIPCCIYDEAIYGGRCGYVKIPEMDGRVTIFLSGKMISVGAKSIKRAKEQLNQSKFHLLEHNMIKNVTLSTKIRNIVATVTTGKAIPIDIISTKMDGVVYDPETFPGMIVKGLDSCSCLVFASGKIVIIGAKSANELNTASFEIIQRLNGLLK